MKVVFDCSPPARWGLLDFIAVVPLLLVLLVVLVLLLLLLVLLLLLHSTPMFTSALPTLRQALRQLPHAVGTAEPQLQDFERTGHRWTSTWDHWAPLDLNLGPSELSEHRWTSTWDPPSSVSTAGPQRPDRMPEGMSDKVPKCLPDRTPKKLLDRMPDKMSEDMPENMPDRVPGRYARTYARRYAT